VGERLIQVREIRGTEQDGRAGGGL